MTLDELRKLLVDMKPGNYASVAYSHYDDLFPPGEPDQGAREACYNFARSLGCRIDNKPEARQVWFVKDA